MDQSGTIAKAEGRNKDWINKLPNCILSSIISLLTIKDAVDTSMISRQWRHLWLDPILTRRNLEFDIPNIFGSRFVGLKDEYDSPKNRNLRLFYRFKRQDFVSRVNKILQLYRSEKVDSFKLEFFFDRESTVILDEWIRFAITKEAQVLDLHLFCGVRQTDNVYVFPHWLLSELNTSSTLKHLSLRKCVLGPPPDFDRFNQLRTLCLCEVSVDGTVLTHLFSVCLFLESFTLKRCLLGSCLMVSGPSIRLKDFKVFLCRYLKKLDISAVNLASLEYKGKISNNSSIKTPQLTRISYWAMFKSQLPCALTLFSSVTKLETLHLHMRCEVDEIPQSVPTFRKLKQLNLDIVSQNFYLGSVMNILKATPLLVELVITVGGVASKTLIQREIRDVFGFSHDHLKKVRIEGCQSRLQEIELAICILKIATKLESMVIDPFGKVYMGYGVWWEVPPLNEDEFEDETLFDFNDYLDDDKVMIKVGDKNKINPLWEDKGRASVQQQLKEVMTNAKIIIL